jgi:hypothetical protein
MKENIVSVNETEKWFNIENINKYSTENEIVTIKTSPIKEKLSAYTRTQKSRSFFIRLRFLSDFDYEEGDILFLFKE